MTPMYIEKYIEKHVMWNFRSWVTNLAMLFTWENVTAPSSRRHQKVVETAPASALPVELRQKICDAALKLMKNVHYVNAGTVEFLVTPDGNFYFIEVNPRVQVEHTVTEMITGIDIVQTQIKVAEGYALDSDEIGIKSQDSVHCLGNAIQCRITTEDPLNNFMPDSGKITVYRSGGGFGVRLDSGNAYTAPLLRRTMIRSWLSRRRTASIMPKPFRRCSASCRNSVSAGSRPISLLDQRPEES